MNPQTPIIPSVTQYSQQNPLMPTIPNFTFNYGQGSWEKPFVPDAMLVSTLLSKLKSGEVDFSQAANQLIGSANDERVRVGTDPEMVKKSLLTSFGDQSFVGPQGQTGKFNQRNYGFIPETTKNIYSRISGMGPTTNISALKGGLPKL